MVPTLYNTRVKIYFFIAIDFFCIFSKISVNNISVNTLSSYVLSRIRDSFEVSRVFQK